jgi:hypothetical protein
VSNAYPPNFNIDRDIPVPRRGPISEDFVKDCDDPEDGFDPADCIGPEE